MEIKRLISVFLIQFFMVIGQPERMYEKLEDLTYKLVSAGVETPETFYSKGYSVGGLVPRLHQYGHCVERNFLLNFFLNTIFNYYTFDITGYNRRTFVDTMGIELSEIDNLPDATLSGRDFGLQTAHIWGNYFRQISRDVQLIEKKRYLGLLLSQAIENLKNNRILQDLGIAYMRQKIVVEKVKEYIRNHNLNEELYFTDEALAIDLQTMIYHFMKDAYTNYNNNLKKDTNNYRLNFLVKKYNEAHEENSLENQMRTFRPEFTNWPYYRNIMQELGQIISPKCDVGTYLNLEPRISRREADATSHSVVPIMEREPQSEIERIIQECINEAGITSEGPEIAGGSPIERIIQECLE